MTHISRFGSGSMLCLCTLWLGLVLGGFALLLAYAGRPGAMAAIQGPAQLGTPADTLVVIGVHTECPCTLVTLRSVVERLAGSGHEGALRVLAIGQGEGRHKIAAILAQLPQAEIIVDQDGKRAADLGMLTSGEVQVWCDTKLCFRGGITPARGHQGDCPGMQAMLSALSMRTELASAPVFGCPLGEGSEDDLYE